MTSFTIHAIWNVIELTKLKLESDGEKGQLQIQNKVKTVVTHSYVQSASPVDLLK